ncbi:hypothetical protein AB833_31985 [Chromatiales bacterium (ex Bugula neritina AB1)]|nr:hypothetical protein AB833_31985 [Chromatiales bacterium (ex Bugula neritina AB1)]
MTDHKIIALWAHPRSMSTAIERIMRERGDLHCQHEPFMYDYYVNRQVRRMPYFEVREDHPVAYADVRDMILDRARQGPVFLKDMSYYVVPKLLEDTAFCKRLCHCFLIRSPYASIASYYNLDAAVTCEEIGLHAQWRHFSALLKMNISPFVIRAEMVRTDPRTSIRSLWKYTGLDNLDHAFSWHAKSPDDWQQVSGWHQGVMASESIRPIAAGEAENDIARFEKLAGQAPMLRDYLTFHLPYYEKLLARAHVAVGG